MPIDEGVIKYDASDYQVTGALRESSIKQIEQVRRQLFTLKLIGHYMEHNVGYGNISQRQDFQSLRTTLSPQFIISGSQTGHLLHLTGEHYTQVIECDIARNKISAMGPRNHINGASSESLTHAAIYQCNTAIQAVIHIHSASIWQGMLNDNLTHTPKNVPYGTPQMADAVKAKVAHNKTGYLAMKGHEDGVITYGENFKQALDICLTLYKQYPSLL